MAKKLYSRSNIDFITKVMGALESFRHKGKPYLGYLQSRERSDEFLMRDNLVKPLFQALGYSQQQDFSPEEKIISGIIDTTIRDGYNHPIIVIETQSSLLKDFTEHRSRLFSYTEEIGARFAVLSDGVRFEAWECPGRGKARFQRVSLSFQELYSRFLKKGVEGLSDLDIENILKLKFLSKELLFIREEELYLEPELHVSDSTVFSQLIDDLQDIMGLVKSDIIDQFKIRQKEHEEYQDLIAKAKTQKVYPSEFKKYEPAKQAIIESFNEWQKVSPGANSRSEELFCTETMYILFNRLLLIRICEDKGLTKRQISNGGIKTWLSWKGFMEFKKANYAELLRSAYETMNRVYPHLFRPGIFDWYQPESDIVLHSLFVFNRYNFKNVDRDVLGKLYEKYIDKEERKKLGQFYTPEEVIDYILESVGYTPEKDIEGKRLLDPACGSGGFLVRATKALVERYQRRNVPTEVILNHVRANIYGFDINPFAAHLAEMNLLFQVIDLINEAKKASPDFNMGKFNIFVTDSLKMPKVEEQGQLSLGEETSEYVEEGEIVKQIKLKQGDFSDGFDFVVGNPPYVRNRALSTKDKDYYTKEYPEYAFKKFDIYVLFIGRGIELLKEGGKFGFIVSNRFAVSDYGLKLREYILTECAIDQIVDISHMEVFQEVSPYPCLLILRKESDRVKREQGEVLLKTGLVTKRDLLAHNYRINKVLQKVFLESEGKLFLVDYTAERFIVIGRLRHNTVPLGQLCNINEGIHTGNVRQKLLVNKRVDNTCKPVLRGENVEKYGYKWDGLWIRYDPKFIDKASGEYGSFRDESIFSCKEKIICREIHTELTATYDDQQIYFLNHLYSITAKRPDINLKYILGLLNSDLLNSYFVSLFGGTHIRGNYIQFKAFYLKQLPIKLATAEQRQEIIKLVDQLLEVNRKLPELQKLAGDLPQLLKVHNIQTKDLADCPDASLIMEREILGKAKIRREHRRVYLDLKSYIECIDENLARYFELYLNSIEGQIQGKTKTDLYRLLQVPKTAKDIEAILTKQETMLKQAEGLKQRRDDIDAEINAKVCELYGIDPEGNKER